MDHLRWDLTELGYSGPEDPKIGTDLAHALELAQEFEKAYHGKINVLDLGTDTLGFALMRLEQILQIRWRLFAYSYMTFSLDTQNPAASILRAKVSEADAAISRHLIFFDLEWKALPQEQAAVLINHSDLRTWRHYLEVSRLFAPYALSEPEEKVLNEFSPVISAWGKHFEKIIGRVKAMRVPLPKALSEAAHHPNRGERRRYYDSISRALKAEAPYIIDVLNAVLLEHLTDVRVRGYSNPMAPRNIGNELSPAAVEALLRSCDDSTGLVARYYDLKRRIMGVGRLAAYDRYAPIGLDEGTIGLGPARDLVIGAFSDFSDVTGGIAIRAFQEGWFDTPVREGKEGGAYAYPIPFLHPFIMLNWTGKKKDALTLAHELGHGIHQDLYSLLSLLQCDPPTILAETASVFGEQLTFARLMAMTTNPEERLALLCGMIEDVISTSYRQAAITRFEQQLYEGRAQGELSIEAVNVMWLETQRAALGGGVDLADSYGHWWVYISHLLRPFYCYGYTFGQFLVLALYGKYLEEGETFVPPYLDLLRAGSSDSPTNLLNGLLKIDVEDPAFWQKGLGILEGMIADAEVLAAELGY